jgi:FlaA1/EpsC-like NDP-sugar epimerase
MNARSGAATWCDEPVAALPFSGGLAVGTLAGAFVVRNHRDLSALDRIDRLQRWAVFGVSRWLIRTARDHRVLSLVVLDSLAWITAFYLVAAFRLDTWSVSPTLLLHAQPDTIPLGGVLVLGGSAAVLHCLLAWRTRAHQGRSKSGSFEELFLLSSVMGLVGITMSIVNATLPNFLLPRATPIASALVALVLAGWARATWRYVVSEAKLGAADEPGHPVLIVGAGDGARQLIDSMLRDQQRAWNPVGMLDDHERMRHLRHRGVQVLGTIDTLADAAADRGAETVVVAIPSASAELMVRVNRLARSASLDVKVLPGVGELLSGVDLDDVRDIEPEDFLGRHQIETDIDSIAGFLQGKRVLVTGAGGSIGSELCRQISAFAPAELMLLDRDESALHSLLLSMSGRADLESPDVILANVRDAERMQEIFESRRPQVVFHAAALKHVNILERHASEAVKTNVLGTYNVLKAATSVGVEKFVNISTDKAADPESVLGHTKRITEGLTTAAAESTVGGIYLSVRFGNVLGTSGSVLRTFAAQVDSGGPITVTHPEVTRYFMTIRESVQLVIQAAAIGRDGEALVLDMGKPVKILDVAQLIVEKARDHIELVFTGLKPGEKLHEARLGSHEPDHRPVHPLISHVPVPLVTSQDVLSLPTRGDNDHIVAALRDLTDRLRLPATAEMRS